MPKNPLVYYGLLMIVAAAAVYAGEWVTRQIVFMVPFALGLGILMVLVGAIYEARKKKASANSELSEPKE